MTLVYIGVGSNLEREKHIQAAFDELSLLAEHLQVSTVYECDPVGFDSLPFYNLVIGFETQLSLEQLQTQLKQIEIKWGRVPMAKKYQDRTLDLDILLFGDTVSVQPQIPRHDIYRYQFVLQPLMEMNPDLVLPNDGRSVVQVWHGFTQTQPLRAVDFDFKENISK